jgi:hypothetical protein
LPTGTAVLRPEDFTLASEAPVGLPTLSVQIMAASFQGSRYRLDVDRGGGQEPMIVTLPPTTPATQIAPGMTLELALRTPDAVHVVAEDAASEPPLVEADLVMPAA